MSRSSRGIRLTNAQSVLEFIINLWRYHWTWKWSLNILSSRNFRLFCFSIFFSNLCLRTHISWSSAPNFDFYNFVTVIFIARYVIFDQRTQISKNQRLVHKIISSRKAYSTKLTLFRIFLFCRKFFLQLFFRTVFERLIRKFKFKI